MKDCNSTTRSGSTDSEKIGVQMYGVSLNLTCDYPELVSYLKGLLPGQTCAPFDTPDLNVTAQTETS